MAYTFTYKPYAGLAAASPNLYGGTQGQQLAPSDPSSVASYFGYPPYTGATGIGTGYMQQQNGPNYAPYTPSTGIGTGYTPGETGPITTPAGSAGSPTTPPATPPPSSSGGGGSGGGGGGGFQLPDWSQDPILLKQEALDAKMVADAEAGALAARKQQLINYGDPTLALSVLKDQGTADAAKNNQFSMLAQLLAGYTRGQGNMNEALSDHNLFYSSARVNDLTEAGKQYQGQKYNAAGAVQGALTQIAQQLLGAHYQAQQSDLNAQEAAYTRALQWALANMSGSGGGSGGGDGSGAGSKTADLTNDVVPWAPDAGAGYLGLKPYQYYPGTTTYVGNNVFGPNGAPVYSR